MIDSGLWVRLRLFFCLEAATHECEIAIGKGSSPEHFSELLSAQLSWASKSDGVSGRAGALSMRTRPAFTPLFRDSALQMSLSTGEIRLF